MGGRGSGSGMTSGSSNRTVAASNGSAAVQNVFGMSADTAAKNYWDNLRIPAGEKYGQVESAANGDMLGYHQYDVIRTQAGDNNPDLTNGSGRNMTWKSGYNEIINERLGESGRQELRSAIQRQAQAWLDRNPRPAHPRKDGYKWDGRKYVKS